MSPQNIFPKENMLSSLSCPERNPEQRASIRRNGLFGLAVVVGLLSGIPSPARGGGVWQFPPEKRVATGGLIWIYQRDASSAVTSAVLLIRGGRNAEPAGKSGLAYLATRLSIEIPDSGKIRELMIQSTQLSAGCQEDCSLISIQCLSENIEPTLKILAKVIRDPLFSGLRIDTIKADMLHRGKMTFDDSVNAGHFELLKAFFGPEGSGASIYGTEQSLKAIGRKDVQHFHETRFTASNMILSVVSDIEPGVFAPLVDKYFSGFPKGAKTEDPPRASSLPGERLIFHEKDSKTAYLGLGLRLPPLSPGNYLLSFLADDLLGGGVGSRLWPLRFTERIAYNVNSLVTFPSGEGMIEAFLETSPEKLDGARISLRKVFSDLAAGDLSEEDLAIAGNNARASFLRANETKEARAKSMALFEARGLGCEFIERLSSELAAVDVAAMNAFLKRWFSPEEAVEVVIGPKPVAGGTAE
jgi:zinc protease